MNSFILLIFLIAVNFLNPRQLFGTEFFGTECCWFFSGDFEHQIYPDKCIEELSKLDKQRQSNERYFNSNFDWTSTLKYSYFSSKQYLPTIIMEGSDFVGTIYQIKIEGNDLIITHTGSENETSLTNSRFSITNLKCTWDLKTLKTICKRSFTIFNKRLDKYSLLFRTISDLRAIDKTAKKNIEKAVIYFKGIERLKNRDRLIEDFYEEKNLEFLKKIDECYKDYYFESDYSHSMNSIQETSKEYRLYYDVFSYQLNQDKDLTDESWLNDSRSLFKGFFISLLRHPSLIFQMDLHCLISLMRQSMLMFYSQEDMSSLMDDTLLDKESYLLAYADHLERIADSFTAAHISEISREQFLSRVKIENDLLFLLNQIREKRNFYEFSDYIENNQEDCEGSFPINSYFSKPYAEELEAKYLRSLFRSFVLLNIFLDTSPEASDFIYFITNEINYEENLKQDQDFNIYGRWGTVGYFLENTIKNLNKSSDKALTSEHWRVIKEKIKRGKKVKQLQNYFQSLLER